MANIFQISTSPYISQQYNNEDLNLLSPQDVVNQFTPSSYIEFVVFDISSRLLSYNNNYTSYTVLNSFTNEDNLISQFDINPDQDLSNLGYNQGEYIAYYNFLEKKIGDPTNLLYIKEISSDRTEIRLDSNKVSPQDLISQANSFISERENSEYFVDFYLNFGDNELYIANNVVLTDENTDDPTVLIKLYEPLPSTFNVKSELWVVKQIALSEAFNVEFEIEPIVFTDSTPLQGPNFNLPIKDQINNSTPKLSYNDILSSSPSSSAQRQLNNLLVSKSLEISVDYEDFNDFIHFSSAQTRLENFYYKLQLIESYTSDLNSLQSISGSASSIQTLNNNISNVIENFDNYERFLYYNSGSQYSWPKSNNTPPYSLYSVTSSIAQSWYGSTDENNVNYGGIILSASFYDNENKDQLLKAIPEYLREDPQNQNYELFIDMVAQHYDNIWLYTKDVSQKYNADNRLNYGISKDLVSDAIKDFGLKLYQNNFSLNDLFTAFLGTTASGSLFPFPEITSQFPTPSGFEYVNTFISASNDVIPLDDVNKLLYKRIYHNIPFLLKTKGTIRGLRALITSYGIPDTILRISEFGGKDKVNENDWDYYHKRSSYSLVTEGTNFISSSWSVSNDFTFTYPTPGTVEFRFKTQGIPTSSLYESLWHTISGSTITKVLVLEYTGSSMTSGSYSGSIADLYNEYGTLKYIANPGTGNEVSCSIYLPFYNGDWWSVMVREDGFDTNVDFLTTEDSDFILTENGSYIISDSSNVPQSLGTASLFAGNKIYIGDDGTKIGFFESSSLIDPTVSGSWLEGTTSYFAKPQTTYSNFNGELQEIRYYNVALGTSRFQDFVMNPQSIEGNSINSSPEELTFRAPLGNELEKLTSTSGSSLHPDQTIESFITGGNEYFLNSVPTYTEVEEYYFFDQFPAGIRNRITDKVRIENNVIPDGDTLSPFISVLQQTEASASYTENLNLLEVAFSPQNEINDDIISQIGYFNIGDYIGDARQRYSSSYSDFNGLRDNYFSKYTKPYNLRDFVRLIKFFDNSLFKMIKDFVPARTSLASGIVIKSHLLERNKVPQPFVNKIEDQELTSSIGPLVRVNGGTGGVFEKFNSQTTSPSGSQGLGPDNRYFLTQSYEEEVPTLTGFTNKLDSSQDEFYNGEFLGTKLVVTTQSLNIDCDKFKKVQPFGADYKVRWYNSNDWELSNYINPQNKPLPGHISVWYNETPEYPFLPPSK